MQSMQSNLHALAKVLHGATFAERLAGKGSPAIASLQCMHFTINHYGACSHNGGGINLPVRQLQSTKASAVECCSAF